jgi:hypothetical protein
LTSIIAARTIKSVKEHWTELVVGAFVLISPWLLGFSDIALAKWGNVLCGLVLVIVNVWAIYGDVPVPPDSVNGTGASTKRSKNNKSRETV